MPKANEPGGDMDELVTELRKLSEYPHHVVSLTLARLLTYKIAHHDLVKVLLDNHNQIPESHFNQLLNERNTTEFAG